MLRRWLGAEEGTIVDLLRARAHLAPQAPLLADDDRVISNGLALEEAERICGLLTNEGCLRRGHPVASYLSNRVEEYLWRLGANLGGHVHVSLNREYRGNMLKDVLQRSEASWLVTEHAAWPQLRDVLQPVEPLHVVFVDAVPDGFPREPGLIALGPEAWRSQTPCRGVHAHPDDCASVLFTSGTTGRPKAVRLPHNLFVRGGAYLAAAWGLGPKDVFHAWSPAYHIGGQLYQFGTALASGASCAIFPSFSRSRFWEQVDRFGCSFTAGFANIATYLLSAPSSDRDALHGLRIALLAGISPGVRAAFEGRFGVQCVDSYGMTEAEPIACSLPGVTPTGACGPVNPDFAVRLLDEHGREVATGSAGRVQFKSRHRSVMMLRYVEDATVDRPGPAGEAEWFTTHDLARFDAELNLHFIGREKAALKRRGENVSPREVEVAILGCPGVSECVVVGIWLEGSAEPEIKAVVVPEAGRALTAPEIAAWCEKQLPRYMRPRFVELVPELRYTEVGKLEASLLTGVGSGVWDATACG